MPTVLRCPSCRSSDIGLYMGGQLGKYECRGCGYVGPLVLEVGLPSPEEVEAAAKKKARKDGRRA